MRRSRVSLWVLVVAVIAGGSGGVARTARQTQAGPAPSAPGVLVERLKANGRGEVSLERKVSDPFTGKPEIARGRPPRAEKTERPLQVREPPQPVAQLRAQRRRVREARRPIEPRLVEE